MHPAVTKEVEDMTDQHALASGAAAGTGRAAVAFGPGRMEIREYPVLSPEPDQILVRVTMATICGSDLPTWRGEMANLGPGNRPPVAMVPGHEMTGRIEALGAEWIADTLGNP